MEGVDSLDMRTLYEQAKDSLRKDKDNDFMTYMPFTKDPNKNKENK